MPKSTQNSRKTPKGRPFQKGGDPRINAGGRPKNEQSITYWLREFGQLTPVQLADRCALYAKELKKGGDGMTMFGLIAVKALMELINNASPGVLAQVLERTEGKITLPIELKDWQTPYIAAGVNPDEVKEVAVLATMKLLEAPTTLPLDAALQEAEIDHVSPDPQN